MPDFRVGKPRFRAYRAATQAFAAGYGAVVFDTVVYDDTSGWDGGSGFVVDRSGLYLLQSRASRALIGTAASLAMAHGLNGVNVLSARVAAATTAPVGGAISDILELTDGDVVSLRVLGSAAVAWSLEANAAVMSVVRIGPVAWT